MKDVISCRKIPPPPQRGTINFVSELLTFNVANYALGSQLHSLNFAGPWKKSGLDFLCINSDFSNFQDFEPTGPIFDRLPIPQF